MSKQKLKQELKQIVKDPLDTSEIKHYLPDVNILTYDELNKYSDIRHLLPNEIDYCIILYRQSTNSGHWVSLDRIGDMISYFDSYGGEVDCPLKWNPNELNDMLGQSIPYLSNLFDKTDLDVYYNPFRYQKMKNEVNTCGRWCILRILSAINQHMNLEDFYNMIKPFKKDKEFNLDEAISALIPI
jgi:hypothetical protein